MGVRRNDKLNRSFGRWSYMDGWLVVLMEDMIFYYRIEDMNEHHTGS